MADFDQDSAMKLRLVTLQRLIEDKRMQKVWRELQRMSRDKSRFINPAGQSKNYQPTLEDQFHGMVILLNNIVVQQGHGNNLITKKEIEDKRQALRMRAKDLESFARSHFQFSPVIFAKIGECAKSLELISEEDVQWGLGASNPALIVERQRSDMALRSFVKLTVQNCQTIFGKPMYSTVANVTNVVLTRQDIDASRVRALVRD